jgi:hypothetical protein
VWRVRWQGVLQCLSALQSALKLPVRTASGSDTELDNTQERVKTMMERIKAFAQERAVFVREGLFQQ